MFGIGLYELVVLVPLVLLGIVAMTALLIFAIRKGTAPHPPSVPPIAPTQTAPKFCPHCGKAL